MKRWTRARTDTWCGSCSQVILRDAPMLVIETTAGRQFRRCESCANEPPNVEQLEAEDVRRDAVETTNVARDFKRAAGGDE